MANPLVAPHLPGGAGSRYRRRSPDREKAVTVGPDAPTCFNQRLGASAILLIFCRSSEALRQHYLGIGPAEFATSTAVAGRTCPNIQTKRTIRVASRYGVYDLPM
jgi:hypothetical protein